MTTYYWPRGGDADHFGVALVNGCGSLPVRRGNVSVPLTTSGTLWLSYFRAPKTMTATKLRMYTGGTPAGPTPTLVKFGLFSVATNGDLTLSGVTANTTSALSVASTAYTLNMLSNVLLVPGQWYATAVLVVTGAALPSVAGIAAAGASSMVMSEAPRITGSLLAQTDIPSSIAAGTVVAGSLSIWTTILET